MMSRWTGLLASMWLVAGCANGDAVGSSGEGTPSGAGDASGPSSGGGEGGRGASSSDGDGPSSSQADSSSDSGAGAGTGSGGSGASSSSASSSSASSSSASSSSASSSSASSSSGGCADPAVDCPPTGTTCRTPACDGAACTVDVLPADTPCSDGGGSVCDGAGVCVACNESPDCTGFPNSICAQHQCVPATCTDSMQNGAELGVDCGGGTCPGCADGTTCNTPADCASGACIGSTCAACGGRGQPCCGGATCDAAPDSCAENTSQAWGGGTNECNCGMLRRGQKLLVNEARWSCDGRFQLVMQGDGNLVLYYPGLGLALWSSDTTGTGATYAQLQDDGNFVVGDDVGQLWFASFTSGVPDAYLAIQDDGNLVVYDAIGTVYWASDTCCW